MRRSRRLKILLVPHDEGEPRSLNIPLLLILIVILGVLITFGVFLRYFSRWVDITTLERMERENKILESQLKIFSERAERLEEEYGELKKKVEYIKKKGEIEVPEEEASDVSPLDSLVALSERINPFFQEIEKLFSREPAIFRAIPSFLPVKGWVIKPFGKIRDPFTGRKKPHNGINILAPLRTPVVCPADGKVLETGRDRIKGLWVEIDHGYGIKTVYAHLHRILVKKGDEVKRGDLIGEVGKSGKALYPNLYWEIKKNGEPVDPLKVVVF